ncbi:MAG: UDP-2,3-diacylglucosamine diphosphatase [Gammaproteobacteria bacterium]|nr:UDP-2,3-diacylglucosamine diphosphatase [Gammaproteobacteria bacterium]
MSLIGFIADLHLAEEQPERIKLFLRFLEEQAPRLKQLYILGDLFEVWLGDDLISPAYQPVIDALKQASNTLSINIIHGNRDFLMGEKFEQLSGCKIVDEPLILNLAGEATLLMHGDLLCTDDQDYLQIRKLLRSPEWMESFLNKPAQERIATARELRQKSQIAIRDKDSEIMDANNDEVIKYMERYRVKLLIHGHTHRSAIHSHTLSTGKSAKRYVLDEWHNDHGQILVSGRDGLHFETIK